MFSNQQNYSLLRLYSASFLLTEKFLREVIIFLSENMTQVTAQCWARVTNREMSARMGANSPVRASPIYSDKQDDADINRGGGGEGKKA